MGVILYILLSGQHPFDESTNGLLDRIAQADFSFDARVWEDISQEARDCVQHCLVVSPDDRYSAQQCLDHPFVRRTTLAPVEFVVPTNVAATVKVPSSSGTESPVKKLKHLEDLGEGDVREICKYGKNCYRKNPEHHKQFAHPWLNGAGESNKMNK